MESTTPIGRPARRTAAAHRWSLRAPGAQPLAGGLVVVATLLGTACAAPTAPRASVARADASAVSVQEAIATPTKVAFAADVARGRLGTAQYANARATGDLVRSMAPRYVLLGGDGAYESGSDTEYATQYQPTWGSFKAITKPSPGNHEYRTTGAMGYYRYWFEGTVRPYFAFDLGNDWRGYSLNCHVPCGSTSAQVAWLKRDLAAHPTRHTLGVIHEPRYSSNTHGSNPMVTAIFDALVRARGDLLLSGHDHGYEVFAKSDATGGIVTTGVKQFVVGTGGAEMYSFGPAQPGSLRRLGRDFGVLELTLVDGRYWWRYLGSGRCWSPTAGSYTCSSHRGLVLDSGTRATHVPG